MHPAIARQREAATTVAAQITKANSLNATATRRLAGCRVPVCQADVRHLL